MIIIQFKGVSKEYPNKTTGVTEISLAIQMGEFTALAGPSGSGKSTLLNLAAGLDLPSTGEVLLLGNNLKALEPNSLTALRRHQVGFVFQAYNLFPVLTAVENIEYPLALKGVPPRQRREKAEQALEEVGMKGLGNRLPSQLSGGQQQRVAIARAIVSQPKIIFADEPTANLDSSTSEKLIELFKNLNETKKITFLFSSHDPMVLKAAKRVIEICDGKVKHDSKPTKAKGKAEDLDKEGAVVIPMRNTSKRAA